MEGSPTNPPRELVENLLRCERLLIAYSGGIDSAYLAWAAHQVLGNNMLAVIADSPSLPRTHLADAIGFAEQHGIPLRVIQTQEMERPEYIRNDASRCFHCKDELFTSMEAERVRLNFTHIAYGRNLDDTGDFRPGQRAAEQHHVCAPLAESQLGKTAIRTLAQEAGLRLWDKPASACLASRVEYGQPVTREVLRQIEDAEEALHALGFRQLRVRAHGEVARVELATSELSFALSVEKMKEIAHVVRSAGFRYVALDCEGYRSGSMNDLLPAEAIRSALA